MTLAAWHNPDFPEGLINATPEGRRNVIDHYQSWTDSQIREDLARRAFPIEVIAENFAYDFNIATVVRNANAFNARGVHILGRRQWDRRGAVGTHHYTPVKHHPSPERFLSRLSAQGITLIAIDNVPGSVHISDFEWPSGQAVAVAFGQESIGVSNLLLGYADTVVKIEQFGSVRSLNVGVTSGVVLHSLSMHFHKFGQGHTHGLGLS